MIKLKPDFQERIFGDVIRRYGGIKGSFILKIPHSSLRGYKNLYFKSVPKKLLERISKIQNISKKDLKKNSLEIFEDSQQREKCLNLGREIRKEYLKNKRDEIPPLKDIIIENYLDFEKWFSKYIFLVDIGFRKVKTEYKKNTIILRYNNYAKTEFKEFEVIIPKKFILNADFNYFFGLWCGDRAGGKRFGVTNKNSNIISFTEDFLRKHSQKVEKTLMIHPEIKEPKISFDKKFVIKNCKKGWVLSVHSYNGILASFFHYLQSYIREFLTITPYKSAFFAGLFDAEGNVSLYNRSFRWACCNQKLIYIYTHFLKKMDLYSRYDGCCIITYNLLGFYDLIFPYLKHNQKINYTKFLCTGKGEIPPDFIKILKFLKKYPKTTSKEISKGLKKKKSYFELKLLNDFGFVFHKGYPYEYMLSSKGQNC